MSRIFVGDQVHFTATFTVKASATAAGTPTDTTAALHISINGAAASVLAFTHTGTGIYEYDYVVPSAGDYVIEAIGTGTVKKLQTLRFYAEAPPA